MGKAARFACILTPMLCTLASLVCTVLVVIGGTNKGSGVVSNLYFFKIDTRYIKTPSTISVVPIINADNIDLGNLTAAELGLDDFYTSSLWNYCSGKIDGDNWKFTECGKPSASYWFNPFEILDEGKQEISFPESIVKVNKAVGAASRVMTAMYVLGLVCTIVTFAVGWFGLLSRWGSCVTTILADISFFFLLTASIISTALYFSMREAYNKALKDFNVAASTNSQMYTITWLAVAFAFASSVFWMFSTCCCSGKRAKVMGSQHGNGGRGVKNGSGGHNYERVSTPYMGHNAGGNSVPMTAVGQKQAAAYEPYRHN